MLEGWGRVKRKIFIKGFKTLSRCSCAFCPTTQPQPQLKNSETIMLSCCVIKHLFSVYLPTPLCLHTRGFWPLTTSSLCLAAIILNLKCKKRILWQPNSFHTFCPDSQMSSEQQRRWKKMHSHVRLKLAKLVLSRFSKRAFFVESWKLRTTFMQAQIIESLLFPSCQFSEQYFHLTEALECPPLPLAQTWSHPPLIKIILNDYYNHKQIHHCNCMLKIIVNRSHCIWWKTSPI